ncbi:MAG: 16S rRNA (guanine(966)-N(2))-methyltransferase RsmD [Proteobacteria bacterium]|nr:16S rRNA (guanine(966)-N(2))-methyltransferase RsmD [Pseudomonadota bacterium]MBU1738758.1 16S rRNA (guanine(966)-N(2))-methyltransferase RsmD [Pseudomonadota bacterium]
MRIISGAAKGRKLYTPGNRSKKGSIRPTSDKVRESIFNILGSRSVTGNVLDLYAGTGALGLEALSRGAYFGAFVDHDRKAFELINRNLDLCGFSEVGIVYQRDLKRGLGFLEKAEPRVYDLVFIDPPYHTGATVTSLQELNDRGLLGKDGLVIVEDASGVDLPEGIGSLERVDFRRYGDTSVWIYQNMGVN